MSGISNVSNQLLQSYLSSATLKQDIGVRVAAKTMDAARQEGDAALKLLDQAAQISQQGLAQMGVPTMGAVVSGLGQNLDVSG